MMKMNTIGIICAMEEELEYVYKNSEVVSAKNVVGQDFYIGTFKGAKVVMVMCGIGKVNAAICTQAMIDLFAVDCIINIGVGGGIYKELKIGDVVVSKDAIEHDFDTTACGDPPGYISRMDTSVFEADEDILKLFEDFDEESFGHKVYVGRIGSGDKFIGSKEEKNRIWNLFEVYAADMEGAAIAHTCYLNKMPFVVVRSISDNADGSADISYKEFKDIAARNSAGILEYMIEKMR